MRWAGHLVAALVVSGCCSAPKDPDDPKSSKQAKFVEAWLAELGEHDDAEALERLRIFKKPSDWNAENFGRRVDRHPVLRAHDSIEWVSVHYQLAEKNPDAKEYFGDSVIACLSNAHAPADVEAKLTLGDQTRTLTARVLAQDPPLLANVEIDDRRLVPDTSSRISHAEPLGPPPGSKPLDASLEVFMRGGERWVRTTAADELSQGDSARLQVRCDYADRRVQTTMVSHNPGAMSVSTRLTRKDPDRCEVWLRLSEGRYAREQTWCWTPNPIAKSSTTAGPCPDPLPVKRLSDAPVFVDSVHAEVDSSGEVRVSYALHPNEVLHEAGAPQRAHLAVALSCPDGQSGNGSRPLSRRQYPAGLFQYLGLSFDEDAGPYPLPCNLTFTYVLNTPYDSTRTSVYRGCVTKAGVTPGRCTK